jgi:competence protein ComGC
VRRESCDYTAFNDILVEGMMVGMVLVLLCLSVLLFFLLPDEQRLPRDE